MKIILEFDTDNEGEEEAAKIAMQAEGMSRALTETLGKLRGIYKYQSEEIRVAVAEEIIAFIRDELVDNEVTCV